jgi:subtilisin family serine protease
MTRSLSSLAILCGALAVCGPAAAQDVMLAPPDSHYFLSKGSWGQDHADQWALHRIGFDASPQSAWRLVKRDAQPVIVAVIDTGLDWHHRNIDWETIWRNPNEISGNGLDDDRNDFTRQQDKPWDYDGHGTMTAGIIAASWNEKEGMAGVNPFARLMILKTLNDFGKTRGSYLAEAIAYAADNGARVINLSVGGKERSEVAQRAVDYAYSKGVVMVVAAGNEGEEIKANSLAGSGKVLTVAATGINDERALFSNWGAVSVAAPGVDILSLRARRTDTLLSVHGAKYTAGSAYVGSDKRYYRAGGTSFSVPFVSGLASLMLAKDPSLTNRQVMNSIKSTARDVGVPGVDQFTGYGLIDARAALSAPKDYFLFAGINRVEVVRKGDSQAVRVYGTADADAFKSARLEIGQGETPKTWKPIGPAQKTGDAGGALGDIPVSALAGSKVWQLRVIVTHENGNVREARFKLKLG